GSTVDWMLSRSVVVFWVVNTVMPAMLADGTPWPPSVVTTGSKIASASEFALAPSRTLVQSAEGCTAPPGPLTAVVTTHVYFVPGASGRPGRGRAARTFGMRVSMSNLISTGTGAAVVALAQNTLSVRAGLRTGDVGRVPGVIGPSKKKKIAEVVPNP